MAWDTLQTYSNLKINQAPVLELEKRREATQTMVHRTVWKEMVRQRTMIPSLNTVFLANPEALIW